MVVVKVTVRSGGLHPLEACRAWHLVEEEGYSLPEAAKEVRTVDGEEPKEHALRNAISRVSTQIDDERFQPSASFSDMSCPQLAAAVAEPLYVVPLPGAP